MGRKSNAKKVIREIVEENQASGSKKSKKELKHQAEKGLLQKKDKRKKLSLKLNVNKKKLFGGILTVIMLAILISVGYLLFQKAFRPQPIAKFLSEESTVAILEINSNFEHNQLRKTFNLLKKYPQYSKGEVIKYAEKFSTFNYKQDIEPWLGREIGVALLNSKKEAGKINTLFFAEFLSSQNLVKFIEKKDPAENIYKEQKTYLISGSLYVTKIGNYAFFSKDQQAIYELIDAQSPETAKLYNSSKYRKVENNLPLSRTAFLYFNFDQINEGFLHYFPFLTEKGLSMGLLKPFLRTFDGEGLAVVAMDNNFAIQSFLGLNEDVTKNFEHLGSQENYDATLTNYISLDTIAFWGGENLENQLNRLIEILGGENDSAMMTFDTIARNYVHKYFGTDMDFRQDVLSLFKDEYAFVMEQIGEKNIYKFLFELSSDNDISKIEELADGFAGVGAVFEPKIVEHTLEDGTVGREVVAIPEEILKNEIKYNDIVIHELKMGTQGWGIYYAILNDIGVVSTELDGVKNTSDLVKDGKNSLRSTVIFKNEISPVLNSSDELNYFNLGKFLKLIFKGEKIPDFLGIIESLSSGRNYFNNGVVTINYLHIK